MPGIKVTEKLLYMKFQMVLQKIYYLNQEFYWSQLKY